MAAHADVPAVDLHLHFGVFVPVHRRAAQGGRQEQQPQRLTLQREHPQTGAGQQAPEFVGPVVFADGVEAPVQDALAILVDPKYSRWPGCRHFPARLLGRSE